MPTSGEGEWPRSADWLVAPDSFKGTFSAWSVALALSEGLTHQGQSVDACPVADGGEGTMSALVTALGGTVFGFPARDPLGRPIEAELALLADGKTAVIETASASGLHRLAETERDPEAATSAGTGDLLMAASRSGAKRILLGVGGSATSDGGIGAIEAVREGGGLDGIAVEVLCDTETTFERAAAVFGPQKGADQAAVARLTRLLHETAAEMPRDPRGIPMGGCAGGLSGAMWAHFGATLRSGASAILDALDFDSRAAVAGRVITGEGCLDRQSLDGKLVSVVARRAAGVGAEVHIVAGRQALEAGELDRLGVISASETSSLNAIRARGRWLASEFA